MVFGDWGAGGIKRSGIFAGATVLGGAGAGPGGGSFLAPGGPMRRRDYFREQADPRRPLATTAFNGLAARGSTRSAVVRTHPPRADLLAAASGGRLQLS